MEIRYDFSGKTAVVTGGASGIGRAVALALLDAGASVAVLDRSREKLAAIGTPPSGGGGRLFPLNCDLTEPAGTEEAVRRTAERFGAPHFLVNSVGLNIRKSVFDLSDRELEEMYRVNVFGVFRVCRLVARLMADAVKNEGGGLRKIVNIASTGAWQGSRNYSGYNSSKAALVGATRVMANEWRELGIVVNALCPGPTMTPFVEDYFRDRPDLVASIVGRTPAGRLAEPEDHTGPVLFFLSGASDWLVGQAPAADGGKGLNA